MEAIILAGGFGTRLRSIVNDVPKPMALVSNKPFLSYLLEYLSGYKINSVVLCTGYKHEKIEEYYSFSYKNTNIRYSVEETPLGTGGAIKQALQKVKSNSVIILNGDTLFNINLAEFIEYHHRLKSDISVALKKLSNFDRYGSVILNGKRIVGFEEKKYKSSGYINGGVYILNKNILEQNELPYSFSFEKQILETCTKELYINGYKSNEYFIDIGIPEDYKKAQKEIKELFNE
jgi:D-glycero-alpha-D-manno-heptose 1-phosphate guanylyltransferase